MNSIVQKLLNSDEPCIRYKVLTNLLEKDIYSPEISTLQQEIKNSPRAKAMLSEKDKDGTIPFHPYRKWFGAHWVLASLAEIDYPPNQDELVPLREQIYKWLFSKEHLESICCISDRYRRCASQEGNAVYYILKLGLYNSRVDELVDRLLKCQWPDGGWNCDKKPKAINSSFVETLIPFRALALHAKLAGNKHSQDAADRAAQVFLKRRLFRKLKDGQIIKDDFITLHYPCYYHYDILFALKVMAEAGLIQDVRCDDALNLLESKQFLNGGFPVEKIYYRRTNQKVTGASLVDWGQTGKTNMNEFVTLDSLCVLKAAGRITI